MGVGVAGAAELEPRRNARAAMTATAITSAPQAASTHRQPLARGAPAGTSAGTSTGTSAARSADGLHRIGAGRAETAQAVWPGGSMPTA